MVRAAGQPARCTIVMQSTMKFDAGLIDKSIAGYEL